MSSNKGITLVVLVITIILLLILSGTAVYVGNNTMQNAKEDRFVKQLQEINEAVNMHSDDYENLNLIAEEHTEDNITYNYVLSTESDFNKIGLYNITDTVYANFKDGQVYSKEGINGKHTLKDFGIEYYKPTQEEKDISNDISFEVTLEPQEYSWKYVVRSENIKCNGNPLEGNLLYAEYKEDKNYEWKRVEKLTNSFELEIKDPGIYELKYRDAEGKESDVKEIYAYVKDGLQLYLDGEYNENYKHNEAATTWKDLSGNGNDGTLNGGTWNNNFLEFDGVDDWVGITKMDYSKLTLETVALNKKINNIEGDYIANHQAGGYVILYKYSSSKSKFVNMAAIYANNQYNISESSNEVVENKIYKLSETYDGSILKFFENNTKNFLEINKDIEKTKSETIMILGADPDGSYAKQNFFNGNIYCARIYNRALTEKEIEQNYNIDKIRYNITE